MLNNRAERCVGDEKAGGKEEKKGILLEFRYCQRNTFVIYCFVDNFIRIITEK